MLTTTIRYLTFQTELGWDVMEPVTYLVGLSTLIGGYTWFLYHNREVSYRSAMNFTISRRQGQLYQQKGLDLELNTTPVSSPSSRRLLGLDSRKSVVLSEGLLSILE